MVAPSVERDAVARAVAEAQADGVLAQVEAEGEAAPVGGGGRVGDQARGDRVKRDVPAVVDPRRVGDAELAEQLAGEVERGDGRRVAGDVKARPVAHRYKIGAQSSSG